MIAATEIFTVVGMVAMAWAVFGDIEDDWWTFFQGGLITILGLVGYFLAKFV